MLGVMLQWGGAGFSDLLNQLETLGFFQYVLPFLLVFAVCYAILVTIHVFKDSKGAAVVVALAIGLLSLQFDIVPAFFQTIFPKFGMGLAVLLAALILGGAFITDDQKSYRWIFFGLGMLIFLVVIFTSFSDFQFIGSWWWNQYAAMIITGLVVIGGVIAVIIASKRQ